MKFILVYETGSFGDNFRNVYGLEARSKTHLDSLIQAEFDRHKTTKAKIEELRTAVNEVYDQDSIVEYCAMNRALLYFNINGYSIAPIEEMDYQIMTLDEYFKSVSPWKLVNDG